MGDLEREWFVVKTMDDDEETSASRESEDNESDSESGERTDDEETLELEAEFVSLLFEDGNCAVSNTTLTEGLVTGDTPVTGVEAEEWEEWSEFGRDEICFSLFIVEALDAGNAISDSLDSKRLALSVSTLWTIETSDSEDESLGEWQER